MTRPLSLLVLAGLFFVSAAAAQESKKDSTGAASTQKKLQPMNRDLDDDPDPLLKKEAGAEKPKRQAEKGRKGKEQLPKAEPIQEDKEPRENAAELMKRIRQNLADTEERLGKKDPGSETQKKQDQVVKDLDELIKQENENNNSSSSSSAANQNSEQSQQQQRQQSQRQQASKSQASSPREKNSQAGAKKDEAKAQDAGPKDRKKSAKNQKPDRLAGDKSSGKKGQSDKTARNTIADLFQDIWGHLPQTRRMEMDAYSRERLMPRYEEILRQYYRTIAEQNRRKQGE